MQEIAGCMYNKTVSLSLLSKLRRSINRDVAFSGATQIMELRKWKISQKPNKVL